MRWDTDKLGRAKWWCEWVLDENGAARQMSGGCFGLGIRVGSDGLEMGEGFSGALLQHKGEIRPNTKNKKKSTAFGAV